MRKDNPRVFVMNGDFETALYLFRGRVIAARINMLLKLCRTTAKPSGLRRLKNYAA
jgi:hypothetical protein